MLTVIYGDNWESFVVKLEDKIFVNAFNRNKIKDTGYYDIEPFLGYSGPLVNTADRSFLNLALEKYSEFCFKEKIIAEITRFSPHLQNHLLFSETAVKVFPVKDIIITKCFQEREQQLKEFSKSRKRDIKTAEKSLGFGKKGSIDHFKKLYFNSINDRQAKKEWFFGDLFFERIAQSGKFRIFEAKEDDEVLSSSIVIEHALASYYFLAANSSPQRTGANDFLLLNICQATASAEIPSLVLGGGNTAAEDDPLFVYKKKFAPASTPFYMGKIIHNQEMYQQFCEEAISINPDLLTISYFLKYRLQP